MAPAKPTPRRTLEQTRKRTSQAASPTASTLYFAELPAWRAWLAKHHARTEAQWVGFYKRGSGKPSITWPESVTGALCFGWIDGKRQSIDDERYRIRFTPRKATSNWSAVNIATMKRLMRDGLVHPAGLAAFAKRANERTSASLSAAQRRAFAKDTRAWTWFKQQAPWYQRACAHWVTSAKLETTRERRLAQLIASSAAHRRVAPLAPKGKTS